MNNAEIIRRIKLNDTKIIRRVYANERNVFLQFSVTEFHISFEDAKDLYQDSMVIFVRKIQEGKLDKISLSIKSYLFGVAKQLIRNKVKSEFKRRRREEVYTFTRPKYDEMYTEDERFKLVVGVLNRMPDPCRSILKSFYIENSSLAEIALSLHYKSANSVKVQKYRCLNKLKNELFKININIDQL
jgi:RNA polymerase sigma-70 factor (ECF subfamily)